MGKKTNDNNKAIRSPTKSKPQRITRFGLPEDLADTFGNMKITDLNNITKRPKTVRVTRRILSEAVSDSDDDGIQKELNKSRERIEFLDPDSELIRVPRADGGYDEFDIGPIDEENPALDEAIRQYHARRSHGGKHRKTAKKRRSNKRRRTNRRRR
jgi:hypothetical protein